MEIPHAVLYVVDVGDRQGSLREAKRRSRRHRALLVHHRLDDNEQTMHLDSKVGLESSAEISTPDPIREFEERVAFVKATLRKLAAGICSGEEIRTFRAL